MDFVSFVRYLDALNRAGPKGFPQEGYPGKGQISIVLWNFILQFPREISKIALTTDTPFLGTLLIRANIRGVWAKDV